MAGRPKLLTRAPRIDDRLPRPRLVTLAGDRPIVIVSGPAGSGATTAAAQIASSSESTVAWCRLSAGYAMAGDIVGMVAESLGQPIEPGRRVIDLADQLLELIETEPLAIVIDDHHLAADGDVDRLLAECAGLLPSGSRFVVATSTRPAGLIGLLPPDQRAVLGPDELAFTDDEAIALFEAHHANADDAQRWNRALGGWAHGVSAGAHAPDGDPARHLVALLDRLVAGDPTGGELVDAASSVDYLSPPVLTALGVQVAPDALASLVDATPLLTDHDGYVRLAEVAADARRASMPSDRVAEIRRTVGRAIADDDPTTAIDLLLDAGEPDAAADVLADHLSEIGVERALNWLYRLPAELRRRFPPVLAAGQATVEVDVALADAEERVRRATTERSRREALLALGSVEAHRGELAAAASALEAALRTTHADAATAERVATELATVRWHLGDLVGARTALTGVDATPATVWLAAQIDLVDGRRPTGPHSDGDADDAYTTAATALIELAEPTDDGTRASDAATAAYAAAVDGGGEPFVAASAVYGWSLVRAGRCDEAVNVAEALERRLGPRHHLARLHGAIIRERCGRGGDSAAHDRDRRRLRDLRARGYATVEQLAHRVLDGTGTVPTSDPLEVQVLGEHRVMCDGRAVERSVWKSKKALEVLTVLAASGPTGQRREQVIEMVWPGRPPDKGRTLLRTALSEIRRTLEPDRPAGEPSRHLTAGDDLVAVDGTLDLERVERAIPDDPVTAFERLRAGLAPTVAAAEWAQAWAARVERLTVRAASLVPDDAERPQRIAALEALIEAEPWQRDHYDSLAELHRQVGDESAAAEVDRRWFADD